MISIDLHAKNALVTGASGELGRTISRTLAKCGCNIAIHYFQNEAKAQALQKEIESLGQKAFLVQADLTKQNDVQRLQSQVEQGLGTIDVLVLNAVAQYMWKPLLEQDVADYVQQFESTVMQAVLMTKAFLPAMVAQHSGRVIAINTECTMQCLPTQSAYVGGKRGMDGILRVLAREVGPHNITVNQVAPGWTETEKERVQPSQSANYEQGVPLRRRGTDQDIANSVVFLASELASFITGAYLPVTGGNVMPSI